MGGIGLVLGGGGYVGHAYHVGMLAGLADVTGWDPRTADVVVGSSAGSIVATFLKGGLSAEDLVAASLGEPVSAQGRELIDLMGESSPLGPARRATWPRVAGPGVLAAALRRPWAARPGVLFSALLPSGRSSAEPIVSGIRRLHPESWPEGLRLCAVRLTDGRRVVFGEPGAPLTDVATAVAASCAIPGWLEPVLVDGIRHVDGGMYSPTNLDVLAGAGLDLVLVSAPMSMDQRVLSRRSDLLWRLGARRYLAREAVRVRRGGTHVLTVEPSGDDLEVLGTNPMAVSRTADVIRAVRCSTVRRLTSPAASAMLRLLR